MERRTAYDLMKPVTGGAATDQPPPEPGQQVVADYVLADIQARVGAGEVKYGMKLMTHNGRDPLWDAYQEAIDLVFYLRQAILEREQKDKSDGS